MFDAIIISDLHLGSKVCQASLLLQFLKDVDGLSRRLIINGDLFDSVNLTKFTKKHWKVLSYLYKLSRRMEVVFVVGNHDYPLPWPEEYQFLSGHKRIIVLHGHIFDKYLDEHPILTHIGDVIYGLLQKIDKSHAIARYAKSRSKEYLRCADIVMKKAIAYMNEQRGDMICTGHTHYATASNVYFNSGSWTELPCSYLTVLNGVIKLERFC